jgi:TPR repeat protein
MKVRKDSLGTVMLIVLIAAAMCAVAVAGEQKYDASTPIDELEALAKGGDADAMLEYGTRLVEGQGVDTSTAEGLDWLSKAAKAGETQAWYALGFVYSNGVGVELDLAKSLKYYRQGAEAGDADCQTAMGMFYQAGDKIPSGLEADPAEAVKWYQKAAEQDHTEAIQHLATLNARGMGIDQDDAEAVRWYRKGAELGNADCMWGLGRCYLRAKGVQQDSVMAYALCSASLDGVENPDQKKAMTEKRDELGKSMTAAQLDKAGPIIREWKNKIQK